MNSGEDKLMGLAPYGNENSEETSLFIEKQNEIVDIKEDGSIFLNQEYFKYTYGLRMIKENKFKFYLELQLGKNKKILLKHIVTWLYQFKKSQKKL